MDNDKAKNKNISVEEVELKRIELETKKHQSLNKILEVIIPKVAKYYDNKMLRYDTPITKQSIWIFSVIVVLIVVGTWFLVYLDKLDASSFTFVIGTVLGYLLTFSKTFWKKESD